MMLLDFPELAFYIVCNHLSYEELLVLRCVCKGLKQFVDGKEFIKLNLFVEAFPYHRRWFYTNQPIGHSHSLHANDISILRTKKFRERFCNVQRMIICNMRENLEDLKKVAKFDLASLNCFKRLTHLEINEMAEINGRLSLENLQIASFLPDEWSISSSSVELDCPRLRALKVNWCKLSLSSETNELEHLYGRFDCYDEADQLTRLYPNIQKLSTICFLSLEDLMKFVTDLLMDQLRVPTLVRIGLEECHALADWDELASSLENLKREPRTKHIQFTLNGRQINCPEELRQMLSLVRAHDFGVEDVGEYLDFSELMDNSLQFLNENPTLDWLLPAVYNVVLHERTEMSEELIKKLENIEHLEFRWECKPTEHQFELFAKHCKSLRNLRLYHLTVTERLLTMLSKHMVNLTLIYIHECKCQTVKPLGTFRNLSTVSLDFDPQRDELEFIFKNNRALKELTVLGNPSVHLMRTITKQKKFKLKIGLDRAVRFDSLDAMVDHLNANWQFKEFDRHNPS